MCILWRILKGIFPTRIAMDSATTTTDFKNSKNDNSYEIDSMETTDKSSTDPVVPSNETALPENDVSNLVKPAAPASDPASVSAEIPTNSSPGDHMVSGDDPSDNKVKPSSDPVSVPAGIGSIGDPPNSRAAPTTDSSSEHMECEDNATDKLLVSSSDPSNSPPKSAGDPSVDPPVSTSNPSSSPTKSVEDPLVNPPVSTNDPPSDHMECEDDGTIKPIVSTGDLPSSPTKSVDDPLVNPPVSTNDPSSERMECEDDGTVKPTVSTNDLPSSPSKSDHNPLVNPPVSTNNPPNDHMDCKKDATDKPVLSPDVPPNHPKTSPTKSPKEPEQPVNDPPRPNFESSKNDDKGAKKNKKAKTVLDFKKMPLEEKRKYYRCGKDYVTLDEIQPWPDYVKDNHYSLTKMGYLERDEEFSNDNHHINKKVSLWQGDITLLEIDAIVNAANNSLLGGGGVDGCIHRAAGKGLLEECRKLHGCETGEAKITSGHKLPAKYVIHTVGPNVFYKVSKKQKNKLESCYKSCLEQMEENKLSSIAFCCISTGIYGYPNFDAAEVAVKTVKTWLEENKDWMGRIIFCVFLQEDCEIYRMLMLQHFPCTVKKQKEEKVSNEKLSDEKVNDEKTGNTVDSKEPNVKESKSSQNDGKLDPGKTTGRGRGSGNKDTSNVAKPKDPTAKPGEGKSKASKGRGRGSASTSTTASKVSKPQTLLSQAKGSKNSNVEKKQNTDHSESVSREKEGHGDEERMDISESKATAKIWESAL